MKIQLILALVAAVLLSSCTDNNIDGKWDDNIKLSTKMVNFSSSADSTELTTKGEWWWLSEIRVDGIEYYGFDSIDVLSDNYLIKIDSITFERRGKTSMVIKVGSNPTSSERNFGIGLQAGNYFDYISITQEAD